MYVLHVRSVFEYCCVLWFNSLNLTQIKMLVSVEKRALSIITGIYVRSSNYLHVCSSVNLSNLYERWKQLLFNFGVHKIKNDKYKHWLEKFMITRKENFSSRFNNNIYNFRITPARYEKYCRSTIPALIRLLRENTSNALK